MRLRRDAMIARVSMNRFPCAGQLGITYDWRIPGIICIVEEPVMFRFHDRLDSFEISVCNGVPHCRECLHPSGECSVGMAEDRQGGLGQLASKGDRHILGY